MLREATKRPHRMQVAISLTLICVQMYYFFFKAALIVVFKSGSFSLCLDARLFSLFFNTVLKISQRRFSSILLVYFM